MTRTKTMKPVVNLSYNMKLGIDELRGDIPRARMVHRLLTLALRDDELILAALNGEGNV